MKCILIAAALALSACATTPTAVQTASSKAVIAGDESYRAASQFGQSLVLLGKLDKVAFQRLDTQAYVALTALQAAQRAGTATDIQTATTNLGIAIAAIYALGSR